jgi:hypothetical protein
MRQVLAAATLVLPLNWHSRARGQAEPDPGKARQLLSHAGTRVDMDYCQRSAKAGNEGFRLA